MGVEALRAELRDLIVELCVERREVTLSSGKKSDFYLDLRRLLMRPRGIRLAGELMLAKLMAGPWVDSVGGMAVAAVPLREQPRGIGEVLGPVEWHYMNLHRAAMITACRGIDIGAGAAQSLHSTRRARCEGGRHA